MTLKLPIYMDNNSTTRVDPRVVEAMLPYFTEKFGNAASRNHAFGWEAEEAVDQAREQIAGLIGARDPKEIIFTRGATESNNLAHQGRGRDVPRRRATTSSPPATEHKAVLDPCKRLERDGFQVTFLPVDKYGRVDAEQVARGDHRQDDPGHHHGGQQRDRHRCSRSRRSASCARRRACCSTPTPCRRSARCRSTSRRWASTC